MSLFKEHFKILVIIPLFFFSLFVSFNIVESFFPSLYISGELQVNSRSFDYLAYSKIARMEAYIGGLGIYLGIPIEVLSKLVPSLVVSFFAYILLGYFLNAHKKSIAVLLTLLVFTVNIFTVGNYYHLEILKSHSVSGILGSLLLFANYLLLISKSCWTWPSILLTSLFHPVLGGVGFLSYFIFKYIFKELKKEDVLLLVFYPVLTSVFLLLNNNFFDTSTITTEVTNMSLFRKLWDIHRDEFRWLSSDSVFCLSSLLWCLYFILMKRISREGVLLTISSLLYFIVFFLASFEPLSFLYIIIPGRLTLVSSFLLYLTIIKAMRKRETSLYLLSFLFILFEITRLFAYELVTGKEAYIVVLLYVCTFIYHNIITFPLLTKNYRISIFLSLICIVLLFYKYDFERFDIPVKRNLKDQVTLCCPSCYLYTYRHYGRNLLSFGDIDTVSYSPKNMRFLDQSFFDFFEVELNSGYLNTNLSENEMNSYVKKIWEYRSLEDWIALSERYNLERVVVPASWKLKLPLILQDENYRIYGLELEL